LADEALHDTTNLVGIGGNVGLDILRVEGARLDFRDVSSHFAMYGGAAHAEEDSELLLLSEWAKNTEATFTHAPTRPCLDNVSTQFPESAVLAQACSPGFFAAQSAHLSFPGTFNRSCSMRSLRACCLLVTILAMLILVTTCENGKGRLKRC
ncbi:hypothetical protein KCU98_g213, partial [Aureobasidium melanogenum]